MQFRAKDSYSLALSKLEKVRPPPAEAWTGGGAGARAWHCPLCWGLQTLRSAPLGGLLVVQPTPWGLRWGADLVPPMPGAGLVTSRVSDANTGDPVTRFFCSDMDSDSEICSFYPVPSRCMWSPGIHGDGIVLGHTAGGIVLGHTAELESTFCLSGLCEGSSWVGCGAHQGHGDRPLRTQAPARDMGTGHWGHRATLVLSPWHIGWPQPLPGPLLSPAAALPSTVRVTARRWSEGSTHGAQGETQRGAPVAMVSSSHHSPRAPHLLHG